MNMHDIALSQAGNEGAFSGCPLSAIDPADPELLKNPGSYYRRLRDEAPVWRDPNTGVVYVSTYELVKEVVLAPTVFSSDFMQKLTTGTSEPDPEVLAILSKTWPGRRTLLYADPPHHARQKHIALNAFTPRRVEALEGRITGFVHRLIDGFIADGECELKTAFADHLPSFVIASMLDLPTEDIPMFQSWVRAFISLLGNQLTEREALLDAAGKILDQQEYMAALIAKRRAQPGEDIISDMLAAHWQADGEDKALDDVELYAMMRQIFTAGQETTVHSLVAGVYFLLTNPDQKALLLANPELVGNFVEETLRHITPVSAMWRKVVKDTELGGVKLSAGDWLLLRFASANFDEKRFTDPEKFDITRSGARQHLSFSFGSHFCLGASLARKQMTVAFPILLDRLRNLRLAPGSETLEYILTPTVRGIQELHLQFDAEPALGVPA